MQESYSDLAWEKIKRLEAENKKLRRALKLIEWDEDFQMEGGDFYRSCRVCLSSDKEGHTDNCIIGNALKLARGSK